MTNRQHLVNQCQGKADGPQRRAQGEDAFSTLFIFAVPESEPPVAVFQAKVNKSLRAAPHVSEIGSAWWKYPLEKQPLRYPAAVFRGPMHSRRASHAL
jgi:hypothetical protein